jgi:hypothetical protein
MLYIAKLDIDMDDKKIELDLACERLREAIKDDYLINRLDHVYFERKGKTLLIKREGKHYGE